MIISGGENIHPLEVEDVLTTHPGVREVAVVGVPDDRWGNTVVAVVVGDASADELDAHCLASPLARFKRPRAYQFVTELPKSASGKILRRELRGSGSAAPSQFPWTMAFIASKNGFVAGFERVAGPINRRSRKAEA